jgi:hypothetical protein
MYRIIVGEREAKQQQEKNRPVLDTSAELQIAPTLDQEDPSIDQQNQLTYNNYGQIVSHSSPDNMPL